MAEFKTQQQSNTQFYSECAHCTEEFYDATKYYSHFAKHLHTCTECLRSFIYEKDLLNHQRFTSHLYCGACDECFASKTEQEKHLSEYHNSFCTDCGEAFTSKNVLLAHRQSRGHWTEYSIRCFVCELWFENPDMLWKHQQGANHYDCCEVKFQGATALREHFAATHNSVYKTGPSCWRCIACLQPFQDVEILAQHQRDGNHAFCCNSIFASRDAWRAHMFVHPIELRRELERQFVPSRDVSSRLAALTSALQGLSIHRTVDNAPQNGSVDFIGQEPNERCYVCRNTFQSRMLPQHHQKTELHGYCCGQTFNSGKAPESHQKAHRHLSSECKTRIHNLQVLTSRMKNHSCGSCGVGFMTQEELILHKKLCKDSDLGPDCKTRPEDPAAGTAAPSVRSGIEKGASSTARNPTVGNVGLGALSRLLLSELEFIEQNGISRRCMTSTSPC